MSQSRGFGIVACSLLVLVADTASAQPGNAPPPPPPPPPPGYAPMPPPPPVTGPIAGEKSEGVALGLSLGGTAVSIALMSTAGASDNDDLGALGGLGFLVAPSFGHWYAGTWWTDGMTIRLAAIGAVIVGAVLLADECINDEVGCDDGPATVIIVGGAIAYVGGGVLDIATAPGAARTYNRRLRERAARGWAITPVLTPDRAGVYLGGSF